MDILCWIKQIGESLAPITTIIALIFGGTWTYLLFIKTRKKYPSANIDHEICMVPISKEKNLLRINLKITNIGNTLIEVKNATLRVQQILPTDAQIQSLIGVAEEENQQKVEWPLLVDRQILWDSSKFEIEPNESDYIDYDVFIQSSVEAVLINSHVTNEEKGRREHPLGWHCSSIFLINAANGGKEWNKRKTKNPR